MLNENDGLGNVVSIFSAGKKNNEKAEQSERDASDVFTAAMMRNKDMKERMKQERAKNNRSVLRSYRIKGS